MSPAEPPEENKNSPWGAAPQNEKPADKPRPAPGNPFGRDHGPNSHGNGKSNGPGNPPPRPPGSGYNNNSNNGAQPDLDELVRRSRERLKQMMPPQMNTPDGLRGAGFTFGAVALIVLWLATGFYRVQEGQLGVVLRFGEVNRTAQPGLRYHLPYPIETALTPNVTFENRIEIGFRSPSSSASDDASDRNVPEESAMLTADQNIVDLDFAVTWVVKDPSLFLFEIRDPEITVKRAAESAMREIIGQKPIQDVLTSARDEIQQDTKTLLQQILDDYKSGVEIVRVELLRVNPPASVVDAFNDVQRAEADRERLRNEAESYRNKIIPEARGEAERLRNEADGYRQQVVNEAKGEASRFTQVLAAYDAARDVTMQRLYLKTVEQVLKNSGKVVLDSRTAPYMPLSLPPRAFPMLPQPSAPAASAPASMLPPHQLGPRVMGNAYNPSAYTAPDSLVDGAR